MSWRADEFVLLLLDIIGQKGDKNVKYFVFNLFLDVIRLKS